MRLIIIKKMCASAIDMHTINYELQSRGFEPIDKTIFIYHMRNAIDDKRIVTNRMLKLVYNN